MQTIKEVTVPQKPQQPRNPPGLRRQLEEEEVAKIMELIEEEEEAAKSMDLTYGILQGRTVTLKPRSSSVIIRPRPP